MQLSETVDRRTKGLFVTYAREDREHVLRLRAGLERLRHEVWVDDRLSVGQAWWQEILSQIRTCDAVVVAVSPALAGVARQPDRTGLRPGVGSGLPADPRASSATGVPARRPGAAADRGL